MTAFTSSWNTRKEAAFGAALILAGVLSALDWRLWAIAGVALALICLTSLYDRYRYPGPGTTRPVLARFVHAIVLVIGSVAVAEMTDHPRWQVWAALTGLTVLTVFLSAMLAFVLSWPKTGRTRRVLGFAYGRGIGCLVGAVVACALLFYIRLNDPGFSWIAAAVVVPIATVAALTMEELNLRLGSAYCMHFTVHQPVQRLIDHVGPFLAVFLVTDACLLLGL